MKKTLLAGFAAVVLSVGAAQAALLQINGGTAYVTPPNGVPPVGNQVIPNTAGFLDGTLVATEAVTLVYEFLGFEAGFLNQFLVDGVVVFNTNPGATVIGTTAGSASAGGALNFGLIAGSNPTQPVNNGGVYPTPAFGLFMGAADASGNVFYIALDDSGNAVDDNHDDLVVKVTATAVGVPEPATLGLLGAGLLGLGFAARRRKAN